MKVRGCIPFFPGAAELVVFKRWRTYRRAVRDWPQRNHPVLDFSSKLHHSPYLTLPALGVIETRMSPLFSHHRFVALYQQY